MLTNLTFDYTGAQLKAGSNGKSYFDLKVSFKIRASSSFAADFEHTGTLDLSNPPQGFDNSATYDNLTVTNTAVTENGLCGNASMTLRVNNQLTISSVNGGITLNSENTDFAVNAPHITIKNVGALSGIHLDGAGSTVKVQNFKTFTIDATGKDQWDLYQGNGLRVHQGKSINLIGQAGSSIKINAAQSGLVVTNDGNISLSADNIEISTWGRGASNPQKPYKGQGVTVTGGGTVALKAGNQISIVNENIKGYEFAHGLFVNNGNIELGGLDGSTTKPTVYIDGKINAVASEGKKANLSFDIASGTVTGDITSKGGAFELNGNLTVEGNANSIENLTGDNATFTIGNVNGTTDITQSNANHLRLATTREVTDALRGDVDAFMDKVSVGEVTENGKAQITMAEGWKYGGVTAELNKDGTVNDSSVNVAVNSLQENTLTLASGTIVALDRILSNDVRKRMGDLRAANTAHGVWARYDGGRFSGSHALENDFNTIQVGIDTIPTPDATRLGMAFSYTKGDAKFARGTADIDAFSLAAYGTWFAENGLFVDVIGRMATANTEMSVEGHKADVDNMMLSLSGELGWRFDLTDTFYTEPRAELAYSYITDDTVDLGHVQYQLDATNSLIGRAGLAAGMKCPNNKGDIYVRVAAAHQFMGDSKLSVVDGPVLELDGKDTWFEFGLGGQYNITDTTYLWLDAERTQGALLEEDWRATIGVHHAF